jgi:hypothetical protein
MRLSDVTDRIMSASATIIAVIALGTGVYQSKLLRDQSKYSVLPYLIQGNSGNDGYSRIVQNVGLGPAKIEAFEVTVDGKPVRSWREVAESLHVKLGWKDSKTTTFQAGLIVPANSTIELLVLPDTSDIRAFRAAMADRLKTYVCFCSLYKDCWESRSGEYEPKQIKACKDDPARRFTE